MTSSLSQMEPELQSIRVLHVDDEPDVAELTATYLKRKDDRFSIEAATSAADGLTQLAEGTFDCIISDYDMPGQNGIQFLTKVRDEYPEIPFILFTGKGSEEVASEAISAGVTDYLQKESGTEQYELLANRVLNAVDGHRTQQLAQEQTRQLETLISNLPGMVYRCRNDPAWPMETVDGDVEDLTGYRADRLEDNDVLWGTEIIHPDDREPMWNTVQEGLSGDGSFEVTYRIVTKNGTTKWMWERGRGIYSADGDLEALEGFITDITEQQEREQELEETNAVLSTVFETATVGILAEDENRNVLTVNERALELFEIPDPPDTVVGTDCERLAAQLSDQFVGGDRFVNRINELVANRTPVDQEVLSVSDGRTFERSYRPLELPDGNGHLWVYQDVTDREDRREMTRDLQQQAQDLIRAETTEAVAETTVEIAEQTLGLPFTGVHLIGDNPNVLEPVAVSDGVRKQLGTAP
ncbi:response regulator [Halorubrum tebenquichense]|nr:response regulator [Halorubrum tebenquichense]